MGCCKSLDPSFDQLDIASSNNSSSFKDLSIDSNPNNFRQKLFRSSSLEQAFLSGILDRMEKSAYKEDPAEYLGSQVTTKGEYN